MKLTSRSPRRRLESSPPPRQLLLHAALQQGGRVVDSARRSPRRVLFVGVGAAIVALTVIGVVAVPKGPTNAELVADYVAENAQTLTVSPKAAMPTIAPRDAYSATPGIASLKASGTNYDFAKLVMLYAGWPQSDNNITVFTRWMRQENGVDDWWNRNNPLNNGWGSGGGGGTGSYDSLDIAAQNAAEALLQNAGYAEIAAAFASSADTSVTENAIWNSPWASGHYAYGGHWSYSEVPVVQSPDGTW